MRRAAQRRVRRRAELLRAASKVFSERGYHAATVADILEAAGVSRGTFYLYFPSKRAVFEALVDTMLEHITDALQRVRVGPGEAPPLVQMLDNVDRLLIVVEEHRHLSLILLREAVSLDDALDLKLTSFYERLSAWLEGALELGQTMGLVRPCDNTLVARLSLGALKEILVHWLTREEAKARDHVAREILDYILHGVFV
ncbi:MAG: TetR/AcrR family transcriptional regulator [Myxococcales bacterium]|nr:TetR/AcrR family transcriptional regulator [Myxococcales bacterium]